MPIRVRKMARARGYRLTMDVARSELRLSMPPRAAIRQALAWVQGQEAWIREQIAAAPDAVPLAPGMAIPLEGREVTIVHDPALPRGVREDGDRLLVGGAAESVGPRLLRWLRTRAKSVLEAETLACAAREGLRVGPISIGDPRSRWGSCASSGAIRYSWRLILAPPEVRRATVAHEVAHLIHMDHSPAFHAAHARLLGADPAPARAWLRRHGAALHRVGG
ncbi:SprT family zinc-dependent metalloprotease [Sphingobium aquiterrae]|uniref:M48 family metallopeptidase n=1 Tax=Sphingobium aquiterrae TaxID=2038656 RepID=UPI0030198A6A